MTIEGLYLLQLTDSQRKVLIDVLIGEMIDRDLMGMERETHGEILSLVLGARWFSEPSIGKFREIINLLEKLPTNPVV